MNLENVRIVPNETDDPGFIAKVENVAHHAMAAYEADELFLIHVKGWFDHKWLKYSGNVLGVVGVWKKDVTVPPFHLNRILVEHHFVRGPEGWREGSGSLHLWQRSSENLKRTLRQFSDSGFFLWFSGDTLHNGKGSVMGYSVRGQEVDAWFVALERKPAGWRATLHKGIGPRTFEALSCSS